MTTLSANTDLARALGDTFLTAGDGADEIAGDVGTALTLCEIESDLIGRCGLVAEDLNRSGVVVRQQADLIDGLEIDLTAFADELDQDPDELAKQLQIITELGLGAEAGILPLVLWEGSVEEPLLLREIFVGLPEPGVDLKLDAALARMQVWLFPQLSRTEAWDSKKLSLDDQQIADLELLGLHLGAREQIVTITEQKTKRENGDDVRYTEVTRISVLGAGGYHLIDFIRQAFDDGQAIFRLAGAPPIRDLISTIVARNHAELERLLAEVDSGGDKDQQRNAKNDLARIRAAFDLLDRAELNAKYGELDWLGAVLVGQQPPPTDEASQALLIEFAAELGFVDPGGTFDDALTAVYRQRIPQAELVTGDPSEGKLVFNAEVIAGTVDFGLRIGAIDPAMVADAQRAAGTILGVDLVEVLANPDRFDLDAVPGELDFESVVQALALRVDPEKLSENQLISALSFISGAETVGDQIERIGNVILAFQTVQVAGAPVLTTSQWKRALGPDIFEYASRLQGGRRRHYKDGDDWITEYIDQTTHLEAGSEQFNWIVDHIGVPGYHKERWNRTRLHLGVDEHGDLAGFDVERIVKRSWMGVVFMAAFTAIAAFTGQYQVVYAIAAKQFVDAARQGDWLLAVASAASTILLAQAASGLASYVGTGAQAAAGAANYGFSTAASVATTVAGGVGLYRAIDDKDVVGGIVAGARLTGFGGVADVVEGVDTTVEGFEDGNYLAAAAGVFGAASAGLSGVGGSGLFSPDVAKTINSAADAADTVSTVARQSDIAVIAIENGDYATAALAATSALASAAAPFTENGVGAEVLGLDTEQQQLIESVIGLAQNGAALYGTVDAALREDVLGAIEILSGRIAEVQGSDESLVGHYAHQLEEIVGVLKVIAGSEGANSEQFANALIPALNGLATALEPVPENLPLFKQPPPPPPPPLPKLVINLPAIDPDTGLPLDPTAPAILPASSELTSIQDGNAIGFGGSGDFGVLRVPGNAPVGAGETGNIGQNVTVLPDGRRAFTVTANSYVGGEASIGPVTVGSGEIENGYEITIIYPPDEGGGFALDLARPERLSDGYEVLIKSGGTGSDGKLGLGAFFGIEGGSEDVEYDTFQRFSRNGDFLRVETGALSVEKDSVGVTAGLTTGSLFTGQIEGFLGVESEVQRSVTRTVNYSVTDPFDLALLEEHVRTNQPPAGLSYVERDEYSSSLGLAANGGVNVGLIIGGGVEVGGSISDSGRSVVTETTFLDGEAASAEVQISDGATRSTVFFGEGGTAGRPLRYQTDIGELQPSQAGDLVGRSLPDGTYTARIEMDGDQIAGLQQQLQEIIKEKQLLRLPSLSPAMSRFATSGHDSAFASLTPELLSSAATVIDLELGQSVDFDVEIVDLSGNSPLAPAGIP